MIHNNTQTIIIAGGVGSRFCPMSTPDYPKQFIDVMGVGKSLIQLTVDRLKPICPVENMRVVTNENDKEAIVTIGIKPSRPETGYSYVAAAEPTSVDEIYKVEAFKEKTNLDTAEFGWSDLGSWGSLRTLLPQDEDGNKVGNDIHLYDCKNCVVHATDESEVMVQGLNGYIVVEKHGQLLVCSLKEEQRIKNF